MRRRVDHSAGRGDVRGCGRAPFRRELGRVARGGFQPILRIEHRRLSRESHGRRDVTEFQSCAALERQARSQYHSRSPDRKRAATGFRQVTPRRFYGTRATLRILIGGVSRWASVLVVRVVDDGAAWIFRTTSIPVTTRPKAPKPWPSGLRLPPKSS